MSATWTCPYCRANVMGSYCECQTPEQRRIAELEAEVERKSELIDEQAARLVDLRLDRDRLAEALRDAPGDLADEFTRNKWDADRWRLLAGLEAPDA